VNYCGSSCLTAAAVGLVFRCVQFTAAWACRGVHVDWQSC